MSKNANLEREIRLHLAKAAEKLQAAKELFSSKYLDDAASRLYYVLFHTVGACLRWKRVDLSSHKHTVIITQFRTHFIESKIFDWSLFQLILELKSVRESADYGIYQPSDPEKIKDLITESDNAFQKMQQWLEAQFAGK
jgi:uncharacterized protein (UPF0332 family)